MHVATWHLLQASKSKLWRRGFHSFFTYVCECVSVSESGFFTLLLLLFHVAVTFPCVLHDDDDDDGGGVCKLAVKPLNTIGDPEKKKYTW